MRPIWSGNIAFGLVSVPVRMFGATESKELHFHFVHKDDLAPIGYDKVRKDTGEHVPDEEIVRAFELEKGRYVPVTEEDFERVDVDLGRSIEISDFVDYDDIDPVLFRRAYYLLPQEGAEKPYRLLVRALEETGKVGIAKVAFRKKEHLACIRTYEGNLLLETMFYADEVRRPERLEGTEDGRKAQVRKEELDMAKSLVESLSEPFDPEKYEDEYRKQLLGVIRAKAKGRKLPEPKVEEEAEVVDLMDALRESVKQSKRGRRRTGKKAA